MSLAYRYVNTSSVHSGIVHHVMTSENFGKTFIHEAIKRSMSCIQISSHWIATLVVDTNRDMVINGLCNLSLNKIPKALFKI